MAQSPSSSKHNHLMYNCLQCSHTSPSTSTTATPPLWTAVSCVIRRHKTNTTQHKTNLRHDHWDTAEQPHAALDNWKTSLTAYATVIKRTGDCLYRNSDQQSNKAIARITTVTRRARKQDGMHNYSTGRTLLYRTLSKTMAAALAEVLIVEYSPYVMLST